MVLIFWLSAQPELPRPRSDLVNLILRKTAHFTAYGVLALCYLWALGTWRAWRWALLLAVLYAISDEYHQAWTPQRHPALLDVGIDTAGAATALGLVWDGRRRIIAKIARSSAADHGPARAEPHV
jgi:VanZ family protein